MLRRLAAFFLLPVALLAWGPIGHMAIADAAYQRLTPTAKLRIAELLKLNPDFASWEKQMPADISAEDRNRASFMIASVWADDIKGETQYSDDGTNGGNTPGSGPETTQNIGYSDLLRHRYWHFIDVPFSPDGTALPAIPTPNAATQMKAFRSVLASAAEDALKSYDLVWLLHIMGDIHQPLHAVNRITQAGPSGDAGGNTVKLQGDASNNLHSYWDELPGFDCNFCRNKYNCVLRALVLSKRLRPASAKMAKNSDVDAWVREGFAAAKAVVYRTPIAAGNGPYTIVPASQYDVKAERFALQQLALAGARMAVVLNAELK